MLDLLKPSRGFVLLRIFKQPSEEVLTAKRLPSCSEAAKRHDYFHVYAIGGKLRPVLSPGFISAPPRVVYCGTTDGKAHEAQEAGTKQGCRLAQSLLHGLPATHTEPPHHAVLPDLIKVP